jgi:hypothetical protein
MRWVFVRIDPGMDMGIGFDCVNRLSCKAAPMRIVKWPKVYPGF